MAEEFKAEIKDGLLNIKPKVVKTPNKDGGEDVTIHLPAPQTIKSVAEDIRNGKRHI